MQVYLGKKKINLMPRDLIGKGGEAEIYTINQQEVIKLFKPPTHPDFRQDPAVQQAAGDRLKEHQQKLKLFPQGLPHTVLTPQALVCDRQGTILGYAMPYLKGANALYRYGDRRFREQQGITPQDITTLFIQLHHTLTQIHQVSIVVGDFNDLNILVMQQTPYFIDTESWQFDPFTTRVFTARFVDPLLCDRHLNYPELIQNHNSHSDWYAFAVMLFRSLLYVEPYGGIYPDKTIPQLARPLHRITVFHPKVKYPKPALPYNILADDLLQYFQRCFEGDQREIFPIKLLQNLQWQTCKICGQPHSKSHCPSCVTTVAITTPPQPKTTAIRQLFITQGIILATDFSQAQPHYLYWENGAFKRETGQIIFQGDRRPELQFWVQGDKTYVGQGATILCLIGSEVQPDQTLRVETNQQQSLFVGDRQQRFWINQGKLWRDDTWGVTCIGDILSGQTQIWLSQGQGFGLYRAGHLLTGFLFSGDHHGINDQVQLPPLTDEIIDVQCSIGRDIWLFLTTQHRGQLQQQVWVIDRQGRLQAQQPFSTTELPTLAGHCATADGLLMTTDQGIAHWTVQEGKFYITYPYPQLDPYIQSGQTLQRHSTAPQPTPGDRLYLIDSHSLWELL